VHLVGFIIKKFVTMHGQMNVKTHNNKPLITHPPSAFELTILSIWCDSLDCGSPDDKTCIYMKEKKTVGRNVYAEVFGAQNPSFW